HDLRAPLRAINGFTDLLALELGDDASEKAKRHFTMIREGGAKMGELIEDLLKLARVARQEVRRIDVDLAAMARQIAQRLREEEPEREVEIVIPQNLPIKGDAGLLSVVIDNLLSNAWKYTGKTGRARIELGSQCDQEGV